MKNLILILILLISNIILVAQNDIKSNNTEIYDQTWILTRMNNKKINYKTEEQKITLIITRENEYASGFSGCNTYVSQVVIKRNYIMFRGIGSTKIVCPDDNTINERIYINNLNDIDSFKIIDEDLYLYKNSKPILIYTKE